jgi:hypothetical protein
MIMYLDLNIIAIVGREVGKNIRLCLDMPPKKTSNIRKYIICVRYNRPANHRRQLNATLPGLDGIIQLHPNPARTPAQILPLLRSE